MIVQVQYESVKNKDDHDSDDDEIVKSNKRLGTLFSDSSAKAAAAPRGLCTNFVEGEARGLYSRLVRTAVMIMIGAAAGVLLYVATTPTQSVFLAGPNNGPSKGDTHAGMRGSGGTSSSSSSSSRTKSHHQHSYHHPDDHQYNASRHHSVHVKTLLLPEPMGLLRENVSLTRYYRYFPNRHFTGSCSCMNPFSGKDCCTRRLARTHKMGSVMTNRLFEDFPEVETVWDPHAYNYTKVPPTKDYRDVLLIRNIWDAIASGYLFHSSGQECATPDGKHQGRWYLKYWERYIHYELNPPANRRTMCAYMAEESLEVGLRAYIDFVFHYHYRGIYSAWAWGQGLPEIAERTLTVCYEDLMSQERDLSTIDGMLDFWYNGTKHDQFMRVAPGDENYDGSHATTHDTEVRTHIHDVAKLIDRVFYNGEIAWADSVLPC